MPKLVSTSEVYGKIAYGALDGVPIAGLVGDQQGALVGNKCLNQGEAKCTYGTGAFLLFCTGDKIVKSGHGLLSTVSCHLLNLCIVVAILISLRSRIKLDLMRNLYTLWRAVVSIKLLYISVHHS